MLQTFLLCQRKNVSQTYKSSSCRKAFPKCVFHWNNLLWWMIFIPSNNWKTFFIQIYCYAEVWCNRHVLLLLKCSEQNLFVESIFHSLSLWSSGIKRQTSQTARAYLKWTRTRTRTFRKSGYWTFRKSLYLEKDPIPRLTVWVKDSFLTNFRCWFQI